MSDFIATFETDASFNAAFIDVVKNPPILQQKDVLITQSGETTVVADEGYDGLSRINVRVAVPEPYVEETYNAE